MPLTKMEHFLVLTADLDAHAGLLLQRARHARRLPATARLSRLLAVSRRDARHSHRGVGDLHRALEQPRHPGVHAGRRRTGALDHIAFNATDYDELLASLERSGVKAHRNITNPNGLRQVFLLDPNGIKLEINIWEQESLSDRV